MGRTVSSPFVHIDEHQDDNGRDEAERKQEREAVPALTILAIDDSLNDIRADDARRDVRYTEETVKHVVISRRRKLGHDRLRKGGECSLEEPVDGI